MNRRLSIRTCQLGLLVAITWTLVTACATGHPPHLGATHVDVTERIAEARTPAEHRALAEFFTTEAAAADAKADEHRKLTQVYSPGLGSGYHRPLTPALDPSRHCQALVKLYVQAAEENRAMAKVHEALAEQAANVD